MRAKSIVLLLGLSLGVSASAQGPEGSSGGAVRHARASLREPWLSTSLVPDDRSRPASYLPDLYWEWEPEPRWLSGVGVGLDFGANIFGSTLADTEYVEVELRFSATQTTYCQTYRRDLGYLASGVGTFPGTAWDISNPSNPRRLNICFVEDDNEKLANRRWDPDESSLGGREYLFIMASDFDSTGLTYDDDNYGPGADNLYGWWPRLETGHTLLENEATLTIRLAHIYNFQAIPDDGQITLSWAFEASGAYRFELFSGPAPAPSTLLATLNITDRTYVHSALTNGVTITYRLEAVSTSGETLHRSVELAAFPRKMSLNMTLIGNLNERGSYGDIWGYTAPDGREYALLCVRSEGLSIIDVSADPLVEVGFAPSLSPGRDAKDVKVFDHYAILIKEHEPAQVIDLSEPANPVTVSTIHIGPAGGNGGAHNALVDGHYLYTMGGRGTGGLTIYDLADPAAALKMGEFQERYYHDLAVHGDTAYAAAIGGQGIDILDLSDKTQPRLIANFNYAGSGAHNCWTTEDGDYLFVGDEIGSAGNWTRIFDVRDPFNVQQVGTYIVDSLAIVHNSYVLGNYLYVAHYTEGVRVVDISDPANAVEVAFYDTYPPQKYGYYGAWSVYPYFASGKIIASDLQTGLYVLAVDWASIDTVRSPPPLPVGYQLAQNYPNPFNPGTTFRFRIPSAGHVRLTVYDLLGRQVAVVVSGFAVAGEHAVEWQPQGLPSGIYLYRLKAGSFTETKKLVIFK